MPIPKEILDVPRPKNTVVIVYGKNKDRYAVRQRVGCRNVNGRHLPINGPTIGHIVDGVYIPKEKKPETPEGTYYLKDWANIVLCDRLFSDIIPELRAVYSEKDALMIYCIAVLRACYPGISKKELSDTYDDCFLSELYPGVALTENRVSAFYKNLGMNISGRTEFMQNRAADCADRFLILDKIPERYKSEQINEVYAFDPEKMEIICSEHFMGDMTEEGLVSEFVSDKEITRGIVIRDEYYQEEASDELSAENTDFYYIRFIKQVSGLFSQFRLSDFSSSLPGHDQILFCKKKRTDTENWLYNFNGTCKPEDENIPFARLFSEGTYRLSDVREVVERNPVFMLESDLDLPAETIYGIYQRCRIIRLIMADNNVYSESDRKQGIYYLIGSRLCSFVSAVLTARLRNEFERAGLYEDREHKDIMNLLKDIKKIRAENEEKWHFPNLSQDKKKIMEKLGLRT